MTEPVTPVSETSSSTSGSSSSYGSRYDAYGYNPNDGSWFSSGAYNQGIEQGISTQSSVDKQSQQETQQQIAQMYESLGQTPPDQSGGSVM